MNKNPKPQIPNPNKIPNSKLRREQALEAIWDAAGDSEPMALHDGPGHLANGHPYDLEERTAQFGEGIVRFSKRIPRDPTNNRLIDQLVGCGTSVGANYHEANEPVSKKDFRFSISRCIKEAKESKYFLRLIAASEPQLAEEARVLYREVKELVLIFSSMYRK